MSLIKTDGREHIPLAELQDGVTYKGHCRNATKATWNAETQRFTYLRRKFGMEFEEDIYPPELDQNYDVFFAQGIYTGEGEAK